MPCYSGYIVNKHHHVKHVTENTKSIQVSFDGRNVSLDDINVSQMEIKTEVDARIVFNTVKQSKICCGKIVVSKHNTTKYARKV